MATSTESLFEFHSARFEVKPEDNLLAGAGACGMRLAEWLRDELAALAKSARDDIGCNLLCARKPFAPWVRCAPVGGMLLNPDNEVGLEVSWTCGVKLKKTRCSGFLRAIDPVMIAQRRIDLESTLRADRQIEFMEAAGK